MTKAQNHKLQKAYIRRYTLTDGKENGIKVVELDNGLIRVLLNESKGLDVMQLFHNGVNISFVSRNGFTARDIDFMNRFEGGMLYTCGFDSIGGRDGFEVHGSYHTYPAKVISILEGETALQVIAEVEITSLFGENLLFERKILLPVDSEKLLIHDTLINRGTKEENYCLLYHVNLGYPMLDEGVKVLADVESIAPRTPYAETKMANYNVFEAPIDNEEETCYFITTKNDSIAVENQKLGKRFTLKYSKNTLPCVVQWNSPASQDYALGIEPATCFLDDRFEYKTIKPNQKIAFSLEMDLENI